MNAEVGRSEHAFLFVIFDNCHLGPEKFLIFSISVACNSTYGVARN